MDLNAKNRLDGSGGVCAAVGFEPGLCPLVMTVGIMNPDHLTCSTCVRSCTGVASFRGANV